MVPFALPVVATSYLLGADLDSPLVHDRLEKLTAAGVSAACLAMFFVAALHLAKARTAYATAWLMAAGSVMFSTIGQALWQHGGVIFWTEVLLLVEFRCWRSASWKTILLQGAACAMMLACRLSAGLIVVSFGVWVFLRAPLRALAIAGCAAAAVAPWAVMNWSVYGTPLGPSSVQTSAGLWSAGDVRAWLGVLASPTHGLAVYQPWLLLALLTLLPAFRRRLPAPRVSLPPGWQAWALAVIGMHLTLVSSWRCWWGGWCWGSRLGLRSHSVGGAVRAGAAGSVAEELARKSVGRVARNRQCTAAPSVRLFATRALVRGRRPEPRAGAMAVERSAVSISLAALRRSARSVSSSARPRSTRAPIPACIAPGSAQCDTRSTRGCRASQGTGGAADWHSRFPPAAACSVTTTAVPVIRTWLCPGVDIAQFDFRIGGNLRRLMVAAQVGHVDREAIGLDGRHGPHAGLVAVDGGQLRKAIFLHDGPGSLARLGGVNRRGRGFGHRSPRRKGNEGRAARRLTRVFAACLP